MWGSLEGFLYSDGVIDGANAKLEEIDMGCLRDRRDCGLFFNGSVVEVLLC
jgi:hypothetical protein